MRSCLIRSLCLLGGHSTLVFSRATQHPAFLLLHANEPEAATFPGSGSTANESVSQKVKAAAENIKKKLGNVTYDNADDTGNDHRVDMYPQGHRSASRSRDRSAQGRQTRQGLADPDDYRVDTERVGRSTAPSGLRNESHNEHHHSHHHGETGELAGGQTVGGQSHHHRG